MMKFTMRSIPAAAAMVTLLVFGAQVQAQTATTPPSNAAGGAAAVPKGPDSMPKGAEQRDMKKPNAKDGEKAGTSNKGGAANMPASPASGTRADNKGMDGSMTGKSGQPAGATATGGAANPPKGPNTSAKDAAGTGTGTTK